MNLHHEILKAEGKTITADAVRPLRAACNDRVRTIYLSGPMSGYPESNYPAFKYAVAQLRRAGHSVYNPGEYGHKGPAELFPVRAAFGVYSEFICKTACTIVLLPGWEKSLGVSAELALARNCRLDILYFVPGEEGALFDVLTDKDPKA